jgi:prepilin-type N-terminal cleavage/methylation domain-containing protein
MKLKNNKSGFTLLEIIIVIIIVGVLASLALPRFFQTVEFARSTEAMNILSSAKRAADRCSIMGGAGANYTNCVTFPALAMDQPGTIPGTHWCYDLSGAGGPPIATWTLIAERNAADNGDGAACNADGTGTGAGSTITMTLTTATGVVTRAGTGPYSGIQ